MNRRMILPLLAVGAALALTLGAAATEPSKPACIAVRTEARYVPYGYNHIVVLTSTCRAEASCSVSTDVNPKPVKVDVQAGTTVEVVTFVASPASSFVARVACELAPAH